MVEYSQITTTTYALTAEGEGIAKDGSHEFRVWTALSPKGGEPKSVQDLQASLGSAALASASADRGEGYAGADARNWSGPRRPRSGSRRR